MLGEVESRLRVLSLSLRSLFVGSYARGTSARAIVLFATLSAIAISRVVRPDAAIARAFVI
jgi:hypothetical protein